MLAEVARRVAQGHREIVLTGINLGCYRDREAGYDLPRLVREVGATPGLARLRLSSIEVNHVDEELVAALRETPTVGRHLHVPLQSGDDGVLAAMGRRYTARHVPAAACALVEGFNLTTDVIVGFPAEDERAFENTLARRRARRGSRRCTSSRTRRGRARARRRTTPCRRAVKKERARAAARALAGRRAAPLAHEARRATTSCSSTGPGRGYGDDYSPWLVDAPVGELVRVRGRGVTEEGVASQPDDCLFCTLVREGDHVATRRRLRRDPGHRPEGADAPARDPRAPRRHVPRGRRVRAPTRRSGCSSSSPRRPQGAGLEDYRVIVNVGPGAGQTVFHLHWHVLGGSRSEACG